MLTIVDLQKAEELSSSDVGKVAGGDASKRGCGGGKRSLWGYFHTCECRFGWCESRQRRV
jgi:hypothetical protein